MAGPIRRPEARTAILADATEVARDTWIYDLRLDAPLPFTAGQFVNLAVPGAAPRGERSYSVWSSPADPSRLELCIKLFPGGAASEYLRNSRVGDTMHVRGPYGIFTLGAEADPVVFVATATGLAPFHSMLQVAAELGEGRRFQLYFGARSQEDLFALDVLDVLRRKLAGFSYRVCLSRPSAGWDGFEGRVTAALALEPVTPDAHYYLCGNAAMIEEMRQTLKDQGVDRKRVKFEKYY